MESKHAHHRSYEDFDPVFKWRREESRDTIELYLPAFKREQIRIQINHLGFLVISGEHPLDGTRWRRFKKEFEIPKYCNEDAIHGNFMQNILSVVMPKKTSLIPHEEEELEEQETQIPQFEHKKEKKTSHKNMEFRGKGITEEQLEEDYIYSTHHTRDNINNEFAENIDHEGLPPETTREVALKFLVVMIVILVIVSYLADMSKSLMAHAHSYFHNY